MSSKVQPANLKERIAALEQRNNASQRPLSPPPTATNSSFLTPQTTGGALKDKIAKFEKKGGVPVPRGSFGLGAPPPAENASVRRRGELYGNRIPSAVRSHITGPQLSGGVSTQITGPSPPGWLEHRHSFALDGKIPGLEYNDSVEDTGGFEAPDSSLGQPQELSFASRTLPPLPVPLISDPPVPGKVQIERRVASDSVRRGIDFAAALELARKAETDKQAVYDLRSREQSLTPAHTGSSSTRISSPKEVSQSTQEPSTPDVVVTGEMEVQEPDSILKGEKEAKYNEDSDRVQAQTEERVLDEVIIPPLDTEIEHSSSSKAVSDEFTPESSGSDSPQSQSVVISLTTPEETCAPETHLETLNANTTLEDSPVPLKGLPEMPEAIDAVPAKSGTEQGVMAVEPPTSTPIPTISSVSAESEAEVSVEQDEKLPSEDAPSETRSASSIYLDQQEAAPSSPSISTNVSGNESDSGASTGSTSTIRDTKPSKHDDEDDDADLFVRPFKKRSPMKPMLGEKSPGQGSGDKIDRDAAPALPPKDTSPDQNRLVPSTPPKSTSVATTPAEDLQTGTELPTARDSYMSQVSQTVTLSSRPESLMDSSSPGHVSFAQKVSAVTSRGVPIFIPASSERQTQADKTSTTPAPPFTTILTPPTTVEPLQIQKRRDRDDPEDMGASEFGVVTIGGGSSRRPPRVHPTDVDPQDIHNRASTFTAVVHGKVRETQTFPASSKRAPSTPTKNKQGPVEPMSPGFNELSLLMQQSALLESRLMNGDYPDEGQGKRGAISREFREKETEKEREKKREKEQADVEGLKLKRTNTMNSGKSHDSEGKKRKLSLKKTFGMGKNARRETSAPLESIPATPPIPKDMSRSKSMDALRSTQQTMTVPPVPNFSLEPPPFPKPKARSIHTLPTEAKDTETAASSTTSSTTSTNSTSGTGMDSDEVPPPPPPKSPSGKYLSSIRRFASPSRSHAGTSSRSSVQIRPSSHQTILCLWLHLPITAQISLARGLCLRPGPEHDLDLDQARRY